MANLMLSMDVKKGDTVALLMYNCAEFICVTFGRIKCFNYCRMKKVLDHTTLCVC